MNNSQFVFINSVSTYVHMYSQFSVDVCSYIGCLFALESSYGTSTLAKVNNNYCGMRNPLIRISTSLCAGDTGRDSVWAKFLSLECCVIDFLLCLQYHLPSIHDYDSVEHFSRFIASFYCPEKDYLSKINSIYSQFKIYKK